MTSVLAPTLSDARPLLRFLRTPKGLLLIVFVGLLAIASLKLGSDVVTSKVIVAAIAAAAIDMGLTYLRRARWILPDGAVLTGMIIAFVLRPQESWFVLIVAVAVAILSKHALRTNWSNIFNPAALALVFAALVLHTGQSWWGALPDLGIIGALVVLAAGSLIADRINKLPMILTFLAAYFTLLTFASFLNSSAVAETFQTPDLQAALFFAFFMLDDPPTSPVRHGDQIVFGIIVATVAYFIFRQFGGVYYLSAGLLVGNVWESGRRLVVSRTRTGVLALTLIGYRLRYNVPDSETVRRLRIVAGAATAIVALVVLVAVSVASSGNAPDAIGSEVAPAQPTSIPSAAQSPGPYPFLTSFSADLTGTYSQTNNGNATDLTLDATTTGDLSVKLHLELASTGGGNGAQATITVNKAQLVDLNTNAVLCDGQLSAFNSNLVRAACVGAGPYSGVQITFEPRMQTDSATTLSGTVTGTMQRTQ